MRSPSVPLDLILSAFKLSNSRSRICSYFVPTHTGISYIMAERLNSIAIKH